MKEKGIDLIFLTALTTDPNQKAFVPNDAKTFAEENGFRYEELDTYNKDEVKKYFDGIVEKNQHMMDVKENEPETKPKCKIA